LSFTILGIQGNLASILRRVLLGDNAGPVSARGAERGSAILGPGRAALGENGRRHERHPSGSDPWRRIGVEVVPAGSGCSRRRLRPTADFGFAWDHFPWGCQYYLENGRMMPRRARGASALRLPFPRGGGLPWRAGPRFALGLLLPIRRAFRLYVNLRPVRLLRASDSARGPEPGGHRLRRDPGEQRGRVLEHGGPALPGDGPGGGGPEHGVHAVRRGAGDPLRLRAGAKDGSERVASATKSNAINYVMPFWDEVFAAVAGSTRASRPSSSTSTPCRPGS